MKVRSPFGKDDLGGAVDLRVKVCSPLGGHKQGVTGMASTSGHGTSRSSRRGRGGVEEAAETRLNNLGPIYAPQVPQEVERVTTALLPWDVENRVKSPWES